MQEAYENGKNSAVATIGNIIHWSVHLTDISMLIADVKYKIGIMLN